MACPLFYGHRDEELSFATYAYDALGRRIAKDTDDGAGGREVTGRSFPRAAVLQPLRALPI